MKALGVLGGPRKGRTTDQMIDAVLKGLSENGAETEKVHIYDYDIKPCTGCCTCEKLGKCVINDDSRIILEKMDAADVIVWGSPVYWSNVTSETKKFFDRSIEFFEMTKMGPKRTKDTPKNVVLVTSCGAPYPLSHIMGITPGALRAMKVFFKQTKAKIHTIYVAGMMSAATSQPPQKSLDKAYKLGKSL